ncbi:MAG: hypothetical protein ABIH26_15995 [Candidatus Eisenbacteria bacterium]
MSQESLTPQQESTDAESPVGAGSAPKTGPAAAASPETKSTSNARRITTLPRLIA